MLRALLAAATTAIALGALGGAAPASASCAPHGARVLAAAGRARVYAAHDQVHACRPGLGTARTIGHLPSQAPPEPCDDPIARIRLTPRFVAWERDYDCRDQQMWWIEVLALRPGSGPVRGLNGVNGCGDGCPDYGVGPTRALVLTASGRVAWVAEDAFVHDGTLEVWERPFGRPRRRLARTSAVDPRTLRADGERIRWRAPA